MTEIANLEPQRGGCMPLPVTERWLRLEHPVWWSQFGDPLAPVGGEGDGMKLGHFILDCLVWLLMNSPKRLNSKESPGVLTVQSPRWSRPDMEWWGTQHRFVSVAGKPNQPSPPSSLWRLGRGGAHKTFFWRWTCLQEKELPLCLWLIAELCQGTINGVITEVG